MARANSTKPSKPHKDFPLFAHNNGHWAKKVRGKLHYFGKWDSADAALEKWLAEKDYLLAGKLPPRFDPNAVTVADVCDVYLTAKDDKRTSGEITERHWRELKRNCDRLVKAFGKETPVDNLTCQHFQELRAELAKQYGIHRIAKEIQLTRSCFKHAYSTNFIKEAVKFGPEFIKPKKKLFRIHKNKNKKLATPSEINTLVDAADPTLKAMIYLGINCGFNNEDCCQLPLSLLNIETGWLDWWRIKTGVERRVKLWPETIKAIKAYLKHRNKPKANADVLFTTKYRNQWKSDSIVPRFRKLAEDCEINRKGLTFTTLRHTFQTIGEESGDFIATKSIMAHADDSISGVYREEVSDDRLLKVTNHIRRWLKGGAK